LTVLERDKKAIELSAIKLKQPYLDVVQTTMDKVTKDLANTRRELRKRSIKVYDEERTNKGIGYKYVCRGYHSNFNMLWPTVRAYMQERLGYYFGLQKEIL
jgi:hypothetical protein